MVGLALPILIEVPALRRAGASHRAAPIRPRSSRRRRLRREVRMGGAAVLLGMPVLLVGLTVGEAPLPWRSLLSSREAVDLEPPPSVSLSTELVPAPYPGEVMPEVRASGYLLPELPDEHTEEAPHAGT